MITDQIPPIDFSLNLRGHLVEFSRPAVMAIINATPDSFYAGSRSASAAEVAASARRAIAEGADMLDIGAYSSRPGADDVAPEEEMRRLAMALRAVREVDPTIPVSVDTFRADVAEACVTLHGADIINDISGGTLDEAMFPTVARLGVPYILMHMRGTPATMSGLTDYESAGGVVAGVVGELSHKLAELEREGVSDIVVDPGFGFAKSVGQNWRLLDALPELRRIFGRPLLVGLSRKSMLTRPLGITPTEALGATIAANTLALAGGAAILRVHDVADARRAVDLLELMRKS